MLLWVLVLLGAAQLCVMVWNAYGDDVLAYIRRRSEAFMDVGTPGKPAPRRPPKPAHDPIKAALDATERLRAAMKDPCSAAYSRPDDLGHGPRLLDALKSTLLATLNHAVCTAYPKDIAVVKLPFERTVSVAWTARNGETYEVRIPELDPMSGYIQQMCRYLVMRLKAERSLWPVEPQSAAEVVAAWTAPIAKDLRI